MVSPTTILQSIRDLESVPSHEQQLFAILELYMEIFPVEDGYLLRYSPLGYLAEGLIYLGPDGGMHIGEIRDDVRNIPIIHSAVSERKAKYCTGLDYLKGVGSKYSIPSKFNTLLVVPVYHEAVVFAYICSTDLKEGTVVDDCLISSFTLYGDLVGKVLIKSAKIEGGTQLLSRRELEVMRRIAVGESTKEMAHSMKISDLTVNQYVKTAIKKLGAKNRSHAVSQLFTKRIIG